MIANQWLPGGGWIDGGWTTKGKPGVTEMSRCWSNVTGVCICQNIPNFILENVPFISSNNTSIKLKKLRYRLKLFYVVFTPEALICLCWVFSVFKSHTTEFQCIEIQYIEIQHSIDYLSCALPTHQRDHCPGLRSEEKSQIQFLANHLLAVGPGATY